MVAVIGVFGHPPEPTTVPAAALQHAPTLTVVVAEPEQPEAVVTVTLYAPDMAAVAFVRLMEAVLAVYPPGPVQE